MDNNQENRSDKNEKGIFETVVKEVVNGISANVQRKYEAIDLKKYQIM